VAEAPTAGAKRRCSADPPGTSEGEPAVAVGGRIVIGDVVAVARGARVVLGPEVRDRLEAARAIVDRHAQADAAVYGLTFVPQPNGERFLYAATHGRGAWRLDLKKTK